MPALTHKKTQENLLEKAIDKSKKRTEAAKRREHKLAARYEARKERNEVAQFKKSFKTMFARFRKLTSCSFDKWQPRHAIFTYKGDKWSIAFEEWHHEGIGWDGYDTNGTHWALHKWCGGYEGEPQPIVDSYVIKPGKDYSNQVIRMLRDYKEAQRCW